ncbi:MAG: S8 family serine peptidase [Muribaculaceae bacterium]|nr:S8 family serine peptidase [Muribaculaceae bacterium]
MKRIHFDGNGRTRHHFFFWQPWGCMGCLGRVLLFFVLFFIFLMLLSQFRSCSSDRGSGRGANFPGGESTATERPMDVVPPIDERDVIDDGARRIVSNRLNVLFRAEVGRQGIGSWQAQFDSIYPDTTQYKVLFCDINTKLMSLQVPAERRRELITELPERIPSIPFLVFEEEVMQMYDGEAPFSYAQNHTEGDGSWYLDFLNVPQAWQKTRGSEDVIVAVVDSYFATDDPIFGNNIVSPYNVTDGSTNVTLPEEYQPGHPDLVTCHGSMVAALALGGDGERVKCGIAPQCSFMPISLTAEMGSLSLLQGILYAINHGAQVINCSIGIQVPDEVHEWPVDDQIQLARRELLEQEDVWKYVFDMCDRYYVSIVWAAGNEDIFTAIDASKRGDNTIKVSSVDKNNTKADFSNFGNFANRNIFESTVSAPGVDVYGLIPSGTDITVKGTSFSAPIVAGAAGLMKSIDPTLSTREIAGVLKATGRQSDNSTIGPTINVDAALDSVVESFIRFEQLKAMAEAPAGPMYVELNTTFLKRFTFAGSDSDILPPLMRMTVRLKPGGTGEVEYSDNMEPMHKWKAPLSYIVDGDDIMLRHDATNEIDGVAIPEKEYKIQKSAADGKAYAALDSRSDEDIITSYLYFKAAL